MAMMSLFCKSLMIKKCGVKSTIFPMSLVEEEKTVKMIKAPCNIDEVEDLCIKFDYYNHILVSAK